MEKRRETFLNKFQTEDKLYYKINFDPETTTIIFDLKVNDLKTKEYSFDPETTTIMFEVK